MATPNDVLLLAYGGTTQIPSSLALLSTTLMSNILEKNMLKIYTKYSPSTMKKSNKNGQVNYFGLTPA